MAIEPEAIPYSGDFTTGDAYATRTLTNPTKNKFTFHWGGKPYVVKAGETKSLPEFLAIHGAKHLAEQVLVERDTERYTQDQLHQVMGELIDRESASTSKQTQQIADEQREADEGKKNDLQGSETVSYDEAEEHSQERALEADVKENRSK